MNWYEEKQEARRQRIEERATKLRKEAEAKSAEGWKRLEAIPFGQPILVGHHSERSDRAYRARAIGKIDKAIELDRKAEELQQRAESVGTSGISSDDPDAVSKLDDKLAKLLESHAIMVERNKEARQLGHPKPYPAYMLTNSNANIRRIRERITSLQRARTAPPMDAKHGNGWMMYEDKEANRIVIRFDKRVNPEVVKALRSCAFLWSPTRKEWVRKNVNARYAIDRIYKTLTAL